MQNPNKMLQQKWLNDLALLYIDAQTECTQSPSILFKRTYIFFQSNNFLFRYL